MIFDVQERLTKIHTAVTIVATAIGIGIAAHDLKTRIVPSGPTCMCKRCEKHRKKVVAHHG